MKIRPSKEYSEGGPGEKERRKLKRIGKGKRVLMGLRGV